MISVDLCDSVVIRRPWNVTCYVSVTMMCFALALALAVASQPATLPDVAIFTNVHARELRFDEVGEVRNRAFGSINGTPALTVAHTDRQNLPPEVQTHVLYRDIGIQLTITSTLPDLERIVDEALAMPDIPTPAPKETPPRKKSPR